MIFIPSVITCAERAATLATTLTAWSKLGLPDPIVQMDQATSGTRQQRQTANSYNALAAALKAARSGAENEAVVLFMEDDLIFNTHLKHNLENWSPLRAALNRCSPFFASLYNCNIRSIRTNRTENYFVADPNAVYGSQCFVLNAPMAQFILDQWGSGEGMQDIRMSRLAARLSEIYYHSPSLVQHVGVVSSWGGHFHDARDFSLDFKAEKR